MTSLKSVTARAFVRTGEYPPWAPEHLTQVQVHNPADERKFLWRVIEAPAVIKSQGRALWPTLTEFRRYWPEFQSFVFQAHLYDDAARALRGASGALLAYYSALNLAKAELLISQPAQIYGQTVGHGLSYSPSGQRGLKSDYVTTRSGVFSLLYEARTGATLPLNKRLKALSLLGNTSDIGFELPSAGFDRSNHSPVCHVVAGDADATWSLYGFPENEPAVLRCKATRAFLGTHFDELTNPESIHGAKFRLMHVLQAKVVHPRSVPSNPEEDINNARRWSEHTTRPLQGGRSYTLDEWAGSLLRTAWLPMPPSSLGMQRCSIAPASSVTGRRSSTPTQTARRLGSSTLSSRRQASIFCVRRSAVSLVDTSSRCE